MHSNVPKLGQLVEVGVTVTITAIVEWIHDFLSCVPCEVDDGEERGEGVISVVCDGGVIVTGILTA